MTKEQVIDSLWNDIHSNIAVIVETRKKTNRECIFEQTLTFLEELKQEYNANIRDLNNLLKYKKSK